MKKIIFINILFIIELLFTEGCQTEKHTEIPAINDVLENFKGEPVVPRNAVSIVIPLFINFTHEFSLSEKLTVRLKDKINLGNRLSVISDEDQADLIAKGTITSYQVQAIEFKGSDKPIRKRLRITASIRMIDIKKNKEIFSERDIQAFHEFSDVIPPITSEFQAQDKVIDDLSSRIELKIMKGWYTGLLTPVEKGNK